MRKYLDKSKREEITIAEEIETLEIYLLLENLGGDGKLHYSVYCDPTMNPYNISILGNAANYRKFNQTWIAAQTRR